MLSYNAYHLSTYMNSRSNESTYLKKFTKSPLPCLFVDQVADMHQNSGMLVKWGFTLKFQE
jgi:hypothetical protein